MAVTDRLAGALGTVAILSLIGLALLFGLRVDGPPPTSQAPVVVPIERQAPQRRPAAVSKSLKRSGRASSPNLNDIATPVEASPALVPAAIIVAFPKPDTALAADSGAALEIGPGRGAGGRGDGTGSGGTGDGTVSGDTPPIQIGGKLDFADMPRALRHAGVGGMVSVRYRIGITGTVGACTIDVSSGNRDLDMLTCALIERRFRFRPARDGAGNPVGSTMLQRHIWTNDLVSPRDDRPEPR